MQYVCFYVLLMYYKGQYTHSILAYASASNADKKKVFFKKILMEEMLIVSLLPSCLFKISSALMSINPLNKLANDLSNNFDVLCSNRSKKY